MFRAQLRPIALILALILAAPLAAAADGPAARVDTLQAALLDTLRHAATEGATERYARLDAPLRAVYDFPFMTRIAVGRRWLDYDTATRDALADAFARLSIATYASHFESYDGETFETLATRDGPKGTRLVDTRIAGRDGGGTDITYVLHRAEDGTWRIANVILDSGISELAVRRSEYAAILKQGGPRALIDTLTAKADALLGR